jgi:hypothetical protein
MLADAREALGKSLSLCMFSGFSSLSARYHYLHNDT